MFGALIILFLHCFFVRFGGTQNFWREDNDLSYDEFIDRDNSDLTYLTYEARVIGKVVHICDHVDAHRVVDGEDFPGHKLSGFFIKTYYTQKPHQGAQIHENSRFESEVECLNCLIQDWSNLSAETFDLHFENCKDKLLPVKGVLYKNTENMKQTVLRVSEVPGSERKEKFENRDSQIARYTTSKFIEHFSNTKYVNISNGYSLTPGVKAKLAFLKNLGFDVDLSFTAEYHNKSTNSVGSVNITEVRDPDINVDVQPKSELTVWWKKFEEVTEYSYTVDLEVENSDRLQAFKTLLQQTGKLNQKKSGVFIDFRSGDSIVLKNVPMKEIVVKEHGKFFQETKPLQ